MTSTNLKSAIKKLEVSLNDINDVSYDSIDKIMRKIMKEYDVTITAHITKTIRVEVEGQ